MVDLFIKTPKNLENVVSSYVLELFPHSKVIPKPEGMWGIVLAEGIGSKENAAKEIKDKIPEVEYVFVVDREVSSNLEEIKKAAAEVAKQKIAREETFAVRTTRRGSQNFTSLDVNVEVGAMVKKETDADVNLEAPDKVVYVEIVGSRTFISVEKFEEFKKSKPGKIPVINFLRRISLVQMPYLGPLDAAKTMGIRIGRAAQTFEVQELIIAPREKVVASELLAFLKGIEEGINTRYSIQKRTYSRQVHKVPVYVQDLYQLVRERREEPIIATSTRGETISKASEKINELLLSRKRINILVGSREGLPTGILRTSNVVLDLSAGITISTDYASVAAIVALITHLEEKNLAKDYKESN